MVETIAGRLIRLAMVDCKGAAWFVRTFAAGKKGTVSGRGFANVCK